MALDKNCSRIQITVDPAVTDIFHLLSKNVRGQMARNAFMMYLRSQEGRQFFNAFNIDLEAELGRRVGLSEDSDSYFSKSVRGEVAKNAVGIEATFKPAAPLYSGFDRTKTK